MSSSGVSSFCKMLSTKNWEGESLMSCEKELQEIATALRKGSPYFQEGWNINALASVHSGRWLLRLLREASLEYMGRCKVSGRATHLVKAQSPW